MCHYIYVITYTKLLQFYFSAINYLQLKDFQVTMQTLWGGDIMALKNMVNELVEIGFENTTQVLNFAGFTKRTPEHDDDLDKAEGFIRGLSVGEYTKNELLKKTFAIEENVTNRVSDCAEEYFRAGICFVLNFLFDAKDFQKKLNEKLA